MKRQTGFTLLELMIVVAVIGVLAAIAFPSYQDSVRKGRRAEARKVLLEVMQQQERHMTQKNTYAAFAAGASGTGFRTTVGENGATYKISAAACTGADIRTCVELTATPQFTDSAVGSLTLTSTGQKSCTGGSANKHLCWP